MSNDDGLALTCQQGCLENYASANGCGGLETISDIGRGTSLEKPGIHRICELVDTGVVDAIAATTLLRHTRSTLALVGKDNDVEVMTARQGSLTEILA